MNTKKDDLKEKGKETTETQNDLEKKNTEATGAPCHKCNCKGWDDWDNDGLCDGANVVGPTGNRCQHPIVSHY